VLEAIANKILRNRKTYADRILDHVNGKDILQILSQDGEVTATLPLHSMKATARTATEATRRLCEVLFKESKAPEPNHVKVAAKRGESLKHDGNMPDDSKGW